MEKEYKELEYLETKKIDNLQAELKALKHNTVEKNEENRRLASDIDMYKRMLDNKKFDIQNLKAQISESLDKNARLSSDKKSLETELGAIQETYKAAQNEVNRLLAMKERLGKTEIEDRERMRIQEMELSQLNIRIAEIAEQQKSLNKQKANAENELLHVQELRKNTQKEHDKLISICNLLEQKNKEQSSRLISLELQVQRSKRIFEDMKSSYFNSESELKTAREELGFLETKNAESKNTLTVLENERIELESLLGQNQKELTLQRSIKEEAMSKRYDLDKNKKIKEKEILAKELELASSQRDLEMTNTMQHKILEDHSELEKNVEALKEHVQLLEYQNETVIQLIKLT